MGIINVLYTWENIFKQIYVISPDCLTYLLHIGTNTINVNRKYEGPTCGIIPFCIFLIFLVPCDHITTNGLKWDMTDWRNSFDTIISCCNVLNSSKITINITTQMIWTITFNLEAFYKEFNK